MDHQILSNFSSLLAQWKAANEDRRLISALPDKTGALKAADRTCCLQVHVCDKAGNWSWQFLGNIPIAAMDEIKAGKEAEIAELDALKAEMLGAVEN